MILNFKPLDQLTSKAAIFLMTDLDSIPSLLQKLDIHQYVSNSLNVIKSTSYDFGKMITIIAPQGFTQELLFIFCLGKDLSISDVEIQNAGGAIASSLEKMKLHTVDIVIENLEQFQSDIALNLAIGLQLKSYSFDYYVQKKSEHQLYLKNVNILTNTFANAKSAFAYHDAAIQGTFFCRDLVADTPNNLYPESFAERCQALEKLGIKVTILDLQNLQDLKMGALLGVAQGSIREPRVAILEWNGSAGSQKDQLPLALVGKGVTFDSGGINLKPSSGMGEMKRDMAGAGSVVGTIMALAMRKAKVRVIGAIGLVENMPSGAAQRPSDVVVSMSGQTIEIDNTDAEGRLVLADVIWYVQTLYNPKQIIDLATLTGAITVALGDTYAGLFSNDNDMAHNLFDVGMKTNEMLWKMPLHDLYDAQINSEIADIKNTGQAGRGGGSITAAHFIKRFIKDGCSWAHLDIAGVAWNKFGNDTCPKGPTGFGVRLLNQYIFEHIEKDV